MALFYFHILIFLVMNQTYYNTFIFNQFFIILEHRLCNLYRPKIKKALDLHIQFTCKNKNMQV